MPTYGANNCTISLFITHPLIFEWFYWLLYVTWCKSQDSYHAITPVRVDICRPNVSVERNIVGTRISTFLFSYLTQKETKLVLLSLAILTLKSSPESTKNYPGQSIQAGKRSSKSITKRSCATGPIDFFHKAQASNFQRRPWSPLCSKSAWSESSRTFCKFGLV